MGNTLELELETLQRLLDIYCSADEAARRPGAERLLLYAAGRLAKCPHQPKPVCRRCPTHCFSTEMRGLIREVMRFAGPRMPLRHPLLTLRYYLR